MKILNLEGTYFIDEFKRKHHQVLSIGLSNSCDIKIENFISLKELINILNTRNFLPDIILWNDICRLPSIIGFETLPCLTIGYSIDSYCNPWHVPFFSIFDICLIAQKDYLFLFKKNNRPQKIEWMPLFFDPKKAFRSESKRTIPISFVGTIKNIINKEREIFFHNFSKYLPILITQGNFQKVYSKTKIVLNQSAAGELNFRIFEAMACGAAVLTEDTDNGLRDLFKVNEEILVYKRGDYISAVNVAKKWLSSPKLEEIANAGYEKVNKYHSTRNRADKILKIAEKFLNNSYHNWRISNRKLVFSEIAKAFQFIGNDKNLSIPNFYRSFFNEISLKYFNASNL